MAANIKLEVVTPEKIVVSDEAEIVMAPGSLGEFGVLTGHTPFVTTLNSGTLRYKAADGRERCIFVSGGYAEALPDKVTVLAEAAERRSEIDINRAKAAMERAEKRLRGESDEETVDMARANAALARAVHRISLAEFVRS